MISTGTSMISTCARHRSSSDAFGRYAARRRTTSAAFTSALSLPKGIDPCDGVPRTRNRRHAMPFTNVHDNAARAVVGRQRPAAHFGNHVVTPDRVPVMVDHPFGSPLTATLLVGDAEIDQGALRTEPTVCEVPERHGHRGRKVQHVDAPQPHTSPSMSSPPNGSCDQPDGFTGTTSV